MIKVVGYFKDRSVTQIFDNVLDAMDFRDELDAHYAKVIWKNL